MIDGYFLMLPFERLLPFNTLSIKANYCSFYLSNCNKIVDWLRSLILLLINQSLTKIITLHILINIFKLRDLTKARFENQYKN